ncbi:unnamed protein product [Pocillopora meandrina]|uniref:Uncharacterized protein n=1 Tax=Pocillopora meandrina TaxID=46732 RepID=A0AAU9XJP5_9CNID|nr:unnamed protein product [Pocillopora meandrina]
MNLLTDYSAADNIPRADGFNILNKKWHAKIRQEEREIGGGNEEIRGVEKLKLVEGEKKKTMEMWERAMEKLNVTKKRHGETEKSEGKRRKKQDDQGEKQ